MPTLRATPAGEGPTSSIIRPPHLAPGARVALVAPAGPVTEERVELALARCVELGLEPVLGRAARARAGYLAGEDALRAADLQWAVRDRSLQAVWALRGGYGAMRLLPLVDLSCLAAHPRALIGFSDISALHLALQRAGVVSFHGPHPGGPLTPLADGCFRRVLFEASAAGPLPLPADGERPQTLVGGAAQGALVGGNLALVAAACGTPAAMRAEGRIVFLEEVGEDSYRIDRMLTQLRLAGSLAGAAGLAFGRFSDVPVNTNDRPVRDVLAELATGLGVPAVHGLPIGHIPDNWTLPLGIRARLDADAGTLELLESAVT